MNKHLTKFAWVLVSLGWVGGATQSARADPMTLQSLLNGASIAVGDKLFTNFNNFSSTAVGGLAVDPSKVFVIPTMEGGVFGITFQGNGQFTAGANQSLATHFNFSVVANRSPFDSATLSLTASSHADGFAAITAALDNELPGMSVRNSSPASTYSKSQFPGAKDRLLVDIDIRLTGGADMEAFSSMDSFRFAVSEPEPATLTLLSIGAVGLLGYRWRRNRRLAV